MDDNYTFCIPCKEYVFEFCSLHGPPLIIPDSKLTLKHPLPIPRAAQTIPHAFLHIAPSNKTESGVGVFSSIHLTTGIRFGPFRGVYSDIISSKHCWRIHNINKSYIIDGGDPNKSNWMRYVNCSRHFSEQNLIAYQQQGHIYYCTIKPIPPYTELLVFYGSDFAHYLNIDLKKYNKPENFIGNTYTTKTLTFNKKIPIIHIDDNCPEPKNPKIIIQNIYNDNNTQNMWENTRNYVQKPGSTKDTFSCDICRRTFNLKSSLTRHKRTHIDLKRYKCTYCSYESNQNYILNNHINATHTKVISYTCNICSKVFYVKKGYKKHQKLHLIT